MIRMLTFPKQGKCLGSQAPDCYHFNAPHRLLLVQQHMMVLFISFFFHTVTLSNWLQRQQFGLFL